MCFQLSLYDMSNELLMSMIETGSSISGKYTCSVSAEKDPQEDERNEVESKGL